jgi:hypothetical protein
MISIKTAMLTSTAIRDGSSASLSGNMENEEALTATDKDMNGNEAEGSPTDNAAANVPGADAAGNMDIENQGALSP